MTRSKCIKLYQSPQNEKEKVGCSKIGIEKSIFLQIY